MGSVDCPRVQSKVTNKWRTKLVRIIFSQMWAKLGRTKTMTSSIFLFVPFASQSPCFILNQCMMSSITYPSPCNIPNSSNSASEIHTYNNLYTKYSRLSHQINSFSRRGAITWNSIPPDPRKLPKSCFKNKMGDYLLQILKHEDDYFGIQTVTSHIRKLAMIKIQKTSAF